MPARRAMSSVDAPCSPCSANSTSAASRISSRRSSFVLRSVTTTIAARLVTTHNLVKCLGDDVEIVRRRGACGTGSASARSKTRVAPGKGALVAVGAEPVQRVRADLRLDALRAERPRGRGRDRPPARRRPASRARRRRSASGRSTGRSRSRSAYPAAIARALGEQLVEAAGLRQPDGAEDVGEAVVQPRRRHVGRRRASCQPWLRSCRDRRRRSRRRSSSRRRPRRS